jgi:hypothetical protein
MNFNMNFRSIELFLLSGGCKVMAPLPPAPNTH